MKKNIMNLVEKFGTEKLCSADHLWKLKTKLNCLDYEDFWKGVIEKNPEVKATFAFANLLVTTLVENDLIDYDCIAIDFLEYYSDCNCDTDMGITSYTVDTIEDCTGDYLESEFDETDEIVEQFQTISRTWYWGFLYCYCILAANYQYGFVEQVVNALQS